MIRSLFKTFIITVLTAAFPVRLQSQQIITLRQCYDAAASASSLSGEITAFSEISALKEKNITTGWLPTMDFNASMLYNSSVVDLSQALGSIPVPGIADAIRPLPHDQYKITLDINQVIYDGGAVRSARELERAELKVNQKQTEADLYKIRSNINTAYFTLLLLDRQKELIASYLELIGKKISSVTAAVQNGLMLRSDIDVLVSEKIRLSQELAGNEIKKTALLRILASYTGMEINQSTELALPVASADPGGDILRPELQLFDLRSDQLSAGIALLESRRKPKAFGFASLGYGNPPGNNFFRDEFDTYYIVGAGIKWNIFDWHKTRNEKQMISLQQELTGKRKADLTDNIKRQLESKMADIASLEKMAESDDELIQIRKRIAASEESKYQNGTITTAEYLNALNAEKQAMINAEIHRINLLLAKVEYLNISGKDPE